MTGHVTFDAIRSLDDSALRALLAGQDAVERLWAIWALGLRQEDAAIAGHLAGEPSVGVRRHICVVLAGSELDLLVAMARHDPADEVRATAGELIVRLTAGGRLPWSVVLDCLGDPAPRVRISLLREVPAEVPPEVKAAVRRAMEDPDLEVRVEAVDTLRRLDASQALDAVVSRLATSSEEEAALLLSRWAEAIDVAVVHSTLREMPLNVRLVAIRHLSRTWSDVAALAGDPQPAIRSAIRQSFQERLDEVPTQAFLHWIDDGPVSAWRSAAAALLERMRHWRPSYAMQEEIVHRCRRRLAVVDAALRSASVEPEGDEYWKYEHPLAREHMAIRSVLADLEGGPRPDPTADDGD